MKKELNDLVKLLTKKHEIECARPEKTAKALKECIDRDYVHVRFKKTGTEIGIRLCRSECKFDDADFKMSKGELHLTGGLTLNYDKVKCIADIDLSTCEGEGYLIPLDDEEYRKIMGKSEEDK
jgi:hypothetical protein